MGVKYLIGIVCVCGIFYTQPCEAQNLSEKCMQDWLHYLDRRGSEDWANRMFDSTGKIESGILDGNNFYEGDYQECIRIRENINDPDAVQGLFCVSIWFNLLQIFKRGMGYCIPHSCSDKDAFELIEEVRVNIIPPATDRVWAYCMRDTELSDDPGAIVAITILGLFGAIVAAATVFDVFFVSNKKQSPNKSNEISPSENTLSPSVNTNSQINISSIEAGHSNGQLPRGYVHCMENVNTTDQIKEGKTLGSKDHLSDVENHSISLHEASSNGIKKFKDYTGEKSKMQTGTSYSLDAADKEHKKLSTPTRMLLCFSLNINIPRLLRAKHSPGSVQCLNGMRFISMLAVVWGHTYFIELFGIWAPPVSNRYPSLDMMDTLAIEVIHQLWLVVDTFFVMSGFLVTYSFMKAIQKMKNKVTVRMMVMYYFHRYWRLTPVYMITLMIYVNLFHYIGQDGPFMPRELPDITSCRDVWWRNLLYIQNLWPVDNWKDCFGWAWYLAIDMQLYIMAPPFIILAYFYPVAGVILMISGYCGSLIANIVIYYQLYYDVKYIDHYIDIYVKPWTRATVYFMGMLLGVLLFKTKGKIKLPKLAVAVGWFVSLSLIVMCMYLPHLKKCDSSESSVCGPWSAAGEVTWNSLISTMYILGVGWIILACVCGYGGFINSFLSWKAWIPLSRLCYCCYLVHYFIIQYFYLSSPKQFYLYQYLLQYHFCGHMIVTLIFAFVLSLVFEIPMAGLERVLIRRK